MLWQNVYTTNTLLVIQEVADAFGLVLVSLVFILSQLISRNSMLSVFIIKTISVDIRSNSATTYLERHSNLQLLFTFSATIQHLLNASQAIITKLVRFLRK